MAVSRLPPAALTLKQFLRRQQVLRLYRSILKAVRQIPNEADRHYCRDWARDEFKRNKDAADEHGIGLLHRCHTLGRHLHGAVHDED